MEMLSLFICVAILVEAFIEYFKSIYEMFEVKEYKTACTQIASICFGVALAFAINVQAFGAMGIVMNENIDMILTGIIMSRGSNYVSDLIGKLTEFRI